MASLLGVSSLLDKAFQSDVGLIKAHEADKLGNLTYHRISRGSNPVIAMASKPTIAEADKIVR